jgi:hypothetical protein
MSVHSTLAAHVTHSPSGRVLGPMHDWCAVHTHASFQHFGVSSPILRKARIV